MNLQHLCTAPNVSVYFDSWNNWLFIDWEGDLTLASVQHACLEVAHCYLAHAYPRVLNSNMHVHSVTLDVAPWLASEFLPALSLAGVEQLAWVCAPSTQGRNVAFDTTLRLPHIAIALFDDVEDAVDWLQHTRPLHRPGRMLVPHPLEDQLGAMVRAFADQLAAPDLAG